MVSLIVFAVSLLCRAVACNGSLFIVNSLLSQPIVYCSLVVFIVIAVCFVHETLPATSLQKRHSIYFLPFNLVTASSKATILASLASICCFIICNCAMMIGIKP